MAAKFLIGLIIAKLTIALASAATDKVICYHGSWSYYRTGNGKFTTNNIDTSLCTHVIYSFVGVDASTGSVKVLDPWLEYDLNNLNKFTGLKSSNSKLKTLIAVGGWNEGSVKYSAIAASPTLRATFIQSALKLVRDYNFDGFDIDWEYPGRRGGVAVDVANLVTLLQEMREAFDPYGLLITAAVSASGTSIDQSYDVPSLSKYLDYINIMTYDLHGSYDGVTGHNAPLYASVIDTTASTQELNVASSLQAWIDRGADPQKLVLGLAAYGRTFTLSDPNNVALGAPVTAGGIAGPYTAESGFLGYNEICEKQALGGWTIVWDDEQKVPHMYKGDQWVGYDDPESITYKVEYAKSLNLAGVMIWSIELEDFNGISGIKNPLLKAVANALGSYEIAENADSISISTLPASSRSEAETEQSKTSAEANNSQSSGSLTSETTTEKSKTTPVTDNSDMPAICTKSGYARDPSNCNKFYYCIPSGDSYIAQSNTCPFGLYFDTNINSCNWPSAVADCS